MTCFPHTVYQGIRDETITAGGSDVRDIEYARSGARMAQNIAPFSCGDEAVDDGMRASRSGRGRQNLADANCSCSSEGPSSQRRATASRPHQTRPSRECVSQELPSPHFPPHFLSVTDQGWSGRSAFPGFIRPAPAQWGTYVMPCHQRSGHISG